MRECADGKTLSVTNLCEELSLHIVLFKIEFLADLQKYYGMAEVNQLLMGFASILVSIYDNRIAAGR